MFKYVKVVIGLFLLLGEASAFVGKENKVRGDTVDHNSVRDFLITPYIAPSYTPELEMMLTGGGLMSFKMQPDNKLLGRSTIPFSVGYSTNNSMSVSVLPYIYGKNDKYRILSKFYYRDMPDNYWGVGYAEGNRTAKTDETTHYHRQWWSLEGKVVCKVSKSFFVGLTYDINETNASMVNNRMKDDLYVNQYGTEITNFGFGTVIEFDKRDNVQNPYNGYLVSIAFNEYNKIFNVSGYEFTKVTFDARKYLPVGFRKTIAIQLKSLFADDTVPWTELPNIGTMNDLRGYQAGRFRDKTSLFGLMEYRHMFVRKKLNRKGNYESPVGFVSWCGLGSVAPTYRQMKHWLLNFGGGIRYEIQPRLNVRVDYGFGKDNHALYVSISEAF